MAKSSRGGRRTGGIGISVRASVQTQAPQAPQTPPQPQQQPQTPQANQNQQGGTTATFAQFLQMDDAGQAQTIQQAIQTGVPVFLDDTGLQKLAFAVGGYGTPQVVDDATLNNMPGVDLYRTVSSHRNTQLGTNYTGTEIAQQVLYSDYTVYNSKGGRSYGNGLYFADDYGESVSYVSDSNPDRKTMRCKITGKIITDSQLTTKFRNDNSQMARAIKGANWSSDEKQAVYAISKGYTAVKHPGPGYYTILNRSGVAFSNRIKDTTGRSGRGYAW